MKKMWQGYTEEPSRKALNVPDSHNGGITHLAPDVLECQVKRALVRKHCYKERQWRWFSWMSEVVQLDAAELLQILKDDAVKVLHSICQQIWKTQQRPQDQKRSVFIPIPKKGNAKECSNYHTIALISHASKVMLKIFQARLQQT